MKNLKERKWILWGLIAASIFACCKINYPSGTWRYKITIEVETPEGIKSGSAVREVTGQTRMTINPDLPPEMFNTFGEAVVVDLGKYGTLFSSISEHSYMQVEKAFPYKISSSSNKINHYSNLKKGMKAELKEYRGDFFVFSNIDDPKTVKELMIAQFEEFFGKGVRLHKVTLEITSEPITKGAVIKKLPWFYTKTIGSGGYTESGEFIPYYKRKPEDFIDGSYFIRK